jgi:hypothetical protein
MRFRVTFKDPDVLHDAIREAVEEEVKALPGLADDEREGVIEARVEKVQAWAVRRFFHYGEYVEVDCDTDANTATVRPRKE